MSGHGSVTGAWPDSLLECMVCFQHEIVITN